MSEVINGRPCGHTVNNYGCRACHMFLEYQLRAAQEKLALAEKVLDHIKENGFPKDLRDKVYDLLKAYRQYGEK